MMTGLKKNKDFKAVYRHHRVKANRYLVMYVMENDLMMNRVGISVSKKVGNSVVRHHLTRLIRESYRRNEEMFHNGWDIVVVVRESASSISFKETESALLHLAGLHHILI